MVSLVRQLAGFLADLSYDDLPAQTIESAKQCILDSMGNMFYGCRTAVGDRAKAHAARFSPVDSAIRVLIPGGDSLDPDGAAFVSSLMARSSDLDDGHRSAMGHPGSFLIPAVMAYGQALKKDGKSMIEAIVSGYETYIRVGETINPSSYRDRGFESTSVTGSVSCAAALGKLYGLSAEEMKNALGIAATFTGGLIEYQNDGSMSKVLSGAWAIKNALMAVQLAQSGYTGPEAIFEGKRGLAQAFSNQPKPDKAVDRLGQVFRISEVYFKAHACMRGLHCAIDAMLELRAAHNLSPEKVASIDAYTTAFVGRLSNPQPVTEIAAQNSLEFTLSVALKNGHIADERLLGRSMRDPEVLTLASKVKLIMDDHVAAYVKDHPDRWGAVRLVVTTKEGSAHEAFVSLPRGEAENPFTWQQLEEKFCRMVCGTAYEAHAAEIAQRIAHFEDISAPGELYKLSD